MMKATNDVMGNQIKTAQKMALLSHFKMIRYYVKQLQPIDKYNHIFAKVSFLTKYNLYR